MFQFWVIIEKKELNVYVITLLSHKSAKEFK